MSTRAEKHESVDGFAIVAAMSAAFKMAGKADRDASWLVSVPADRSVDNIESLIRTLDQLLLSDPKRAYEAAVQLAESFPDVYRWNDDPTLRTEWTEFIVNPSSYVMPLEGKIRLARKYLEHITKRNFGDEEFYEALESYVSAIGGHVGRIAQLMLVMHLREFDAT